MALNLQKKQEIVAEVNEVASSAYSAIAAEYSGLSVSQMTQLRVEARNAGVYLRVIRNTLTRRAVENTDYQCMQDQLKGQLILAFSTDEPGAAARVIKDFRKKNDQLVVKIIAISGKLLDPSEIETLAKMPTYEQSLSMLMSVIMAPLNKFARTLAEPHAKLVRTIAAVKEQKENS